MVWFAAPFDLAGADKEGVVVFHEPGEVTVGAVVAGKPGFAQRNCGDSAGGESRSCARNAGALLRAAQRCSWQLRGLRMETRARCGDSVEFEIASDCKGERIGHGDGLGGGKRDLVATAGPRAVKQAFEWLSDNDTTKLP